MCPFTQDAGRAITETWTDKDKKKYTEYIAKIAPFEKYYKSYLWELIQHLTAIHYYKKDGNLNNFFD